MLAALCQNWSLFVKSSRKLHELLLDDEANAMAVRRYASIAGDSYRNYSKGCTEFGMTPAARSRVRLTPDETPEPSKKSRFFDEPA